MKKNPQFIIQILALMPVLFIPAVVFIVAILIIDAEKKSFASSIEHIEHDFVETEKSRIRSKVNNMVDLVKYHRSIIDQTLLDRVRSRVNDSHKIATTLYQQYKNELSKPELQRLIVESLRPLEWNSGENYIWIVDYQGKLRLGPNYLKEMESKSIIDFKDLSGRKIIQEEINIARERGHGFLWDTFTKPGQPETTQYQQLAYVKSLGFYDWYLGSAEFLETAQKKTNSYLLETINQMGKGDSDYIFVINTNGDLLLNYARPDIVGRNMSETQDESLHLLFNKLVKASKTPMEEFISYRWINPKTGKVDDKLTYVKKVQGSSWIIGSGFYPKALERGHEVQKQKLVSQQNQKIQHLTRLTWLSVTSALAIAILLTILLYRAISKYRAGLFESNNRLKALNISLEKELIESHRSLKQIKGELNEQKIQFSNVQVSARDAIINRLSQEVDLANQEQLKLSVVVFELLNAVEIVDEIGEEAFETTLLELFSEINNVIQTVDNVGRLSRDEFLLIMPETGAEKAYEVAEIICSQLAEKEFGDGIRVLMSAGVIELKPNGSFGEMFDQLEQAAVKAKEPGSQQVYIF